MKRLLLLLAAIAAAGTASSGKNAYGVMTMLNAGTYDSTSAAIYLSMARGAVGDWGHARQYCYISQDYVPTIEKFLLLCRALHLKPLLFVGSIPGYSNPQGLPKMDETGGRYHEVAGVIADWVQALLDDGYKIPYLEVYNEANITPWQPEYYARYVVDVSAAVKAVDPSIQILSGGFSGAATDYIDGMFTAEPDVKYAIDVWSIHIVPGNMPPDVTDGEYDCLCYEDALNKLAEFGAYYPIFVSEGAYYLNDQTYPEYPKLTPALRAEYMSVLWQDFYMPDGRVLGFTPWQFGSPSGGSSQTESTWLNKNYTPNLLYQTIAAIPKTGGSDWMPAGDNGLTGTVVDASTGLPLQYVVVYLMPGPYAALTDENGQYTITGVPDGTYTAATFRDAYDCRGTGTFVLSGGATPTWNADMVHNGYMTNAGFNTGTVTSPGWGRLGSESAFSISTGVHNTGPGSQRIDCAAETRYVTQMSDYYTVRPGFFYTARVWAKTVGVPAEDEGAVLRLQFYDDSRSEILQTHELCTGGGSQDWQALTLTRRAPDRADRLRIELEARGASGTVYFDDAYVHVATEAPPEVTATDYNVFQPGWLLVSTPIRPSDPAADDVFGDVERAGHPITNAFFRYSPVTGYEMFPADFRDMEIGRAYWLYEDDFTNRVAVRGVRPTDTVGIPVDQGWNLVGSPFDEPVSISDAAVTDGVDTYQLDDPAALGMIDRFMYAYDPSGGYTAIDLQAGTGQFEPWRGYWIRALQDGLQLLLPCPYELGSVSGTVENEDAEPLSGAAIVVEPGGYWAETDELGAYSIDGIPAGTYNVSAELVDYIPQTQEGITVSDGANTTVDFTLEEVPLPPTLQNAGFEMGNLSYWTTDGVNGVYTSFFADVTPYEGSWFCGTAASYTQCSGWLYQRVSATPGLTYRASVYINTHRMGGVMMDCVSRIGIDPYGGKDVTSDNIVWSDWYESQDVWSEISVEAVAVDDTITYFLQHQQLSTIEWHQNCYDACWIEPVE